MQTDNSPTRSGSRESSRNDVMPGLLSAPHQHRSESADTAFCSGWSLHFDDPCMLSALVDPAPVSISLELMHDDGDDRHRAGGG